MPKIDLLPCPFCGRRETLKMLSVQSENHKFLRRVVCSTVEGGCGASTIWNCTTPEETAEEWNTRASGWISCSDMMPKKDGEYICVINGEFKILPYRNGEFYSKCFDGVLRCCNSSVTCWMPLPEKPKEVQHDEN
jgi:hypothetical protein